MTVVLNNTGQPVDKRKGGSNEETGVDDSGSSEGFEGDMSDEDSDDGLKQRQTVGREDFGGD